MADAGIAGEYTLLFARNVVASPHESSYLAEPVFGRVQTLTELLAFYRSVGLAVADGAHELPDHIAVELETLAALAARAAIAWDVGDAETAMRYRALREQFVEEHLALWLPDFRSRLKMHARLAFYPAVVDLLALVIELDVAVEINDGRRYRAAFRSGD